MQGERHLAKLQGLARGLPGVRTFFPGYVSGRRKAGFFGMADLYVFPSRHESYGLTLMEALAAGLPAVCLDHQGAREMMRPEFGEMVGRGEELGAAIGRLLGEGEGLRAKSEAARRYAEANRFEDCASRLAGLLRGD
jgi:glycosyltransferase involved in cell wall biosynthesis